MLRRMLAATLLRVDNFEDVEHDRGATVQGVQVAAMVIAVRQCLAYDSTLRAIWRGHNIRYSGAYLERRNLRRVDVRHDGPVATADSEAFPREFLHC